MKKLSIVIIIILIISVAGIITYNSCFLDNNMQSNNSDETIKKNTDIPVLITPEPGMVLDRIVFDSDKDNDGINDLDDFLEGARIDADNKPAYRSNYYSGGYPPDNEGVCTDVIWRAFKNAGYDLKTMIDKDIKNNIRKYPRVEGRPDPNIDFRRVPNLKVFFERFGKTLTTTLTPYDKENLVQWQGGDIVIFEHPDHIAFISDLRRPDGIPYLIHNSGPYTREADDMLTWKAGLVGHYRFP